MIDPTFVHALPPEPDARTVAILDRLTAAHGVIDSFDFTQDAGEDGRDVLYAIADIGAQQATSLVATLATLAALLSDAGSELARLNAENAGLRARSGK